MTSTKRLLGWLVGAFVVVTVLAFALAAGAGGRTTGGWWMPHMTDGWRMPHVGGGWMGMGVWGFGAAFVGLLWTALLVALPAAFVYRAVTERGPTRSDPAMERPREQHAGGETDDDGDESHRRRLPEQ